MVLQPDGYLLIIFLRYTNTPLDNRNDRGIHTKFPFETPPYNKGLKQLDVHLIFHDGSKRPFLPPPPPSPRRLPTVLSVLPPPPPSPRSVSHSDPPSSPSPSSPSTSPSPTIPASDFTIPHNSGVFPLSIV
ncbi:unnamed protein product [Citrullus colocynthis]|uniref:Uncharacterized protein n=1 Tax=Citrullus colocynthis TaxID=252529 RepID=A0ABP0YKG9_9ROSI